MDSEGEKERRESRLREFGIHRLEFDQLRQQHTPNKIRKAEAAILAFPHSLDRVSNAVG